MPSTQDLEPEISTEVQRLVERLGALTTQRLASPAPPYASRAAAGHALAQRFVNVTAYLEHRQPPPTLPWVGELAVADQLSVTAYDLRHALRESGYSSQAAEPLLLDLLQAVGRVRAAVC